MDLTRERLHSRAMRRPSQNSSPQTENLTRSKAAKAERAPVGSIALWLTCVTLVALPCLLAASCGAAGASEHALGELPVAFDTIHGVRVASLNRPTPEVAHLALWIDAGSRDAVPPQLATAAAWVAARRAGIAAQPYVLPDGMELAVRCNPKSLGRCLGQIGKALAARAPSRKEAKLARMWLAGARQRAESNDPGRGADRLALQALLREPAEGFFPLGAAKDDEKVTAAAIGEFFRAHFGPTRALLVAAGDVDADAIRDTGREALSQLPHAIGSREGRTLETSDSGEQVDIGASGQLSVAGAAPNLATAAAVARVIAEALARPGQPAGEMPNSHAFDVRGGALFLTRVASEAPAPLARRAAYEFGRLLAEGIAADTAVPEGESLSELARVTGVRWCTHGYDRLERARGLGIGAVVPGSRADRPRSEYPDAALRKKVLAELQRVQDWARAAANPELEGSLHDLTASMVAPNGARIEVRRRPGPRVSVAVRIAGGAALEPASQHGRTALLSTLAATSCEELPADALAARVRDLQITIEPSIDSGSWGVLLSAPKKNWREAVHMALQCGLHPSLRPADVLNARLRLRERVGSEGTELWLAGHAARMLAPAAPGLVAPWGMPDTIANITGRDLRQAARSSLVGIRLAVAAVGDVPLREAVERIGRRVALLPRGSEPPGAQPGEANDLAAVRTKGSQTLAIAMWRTRASDAGALGALAFAASVRAALGKSPGIRPVWHDAGNGSWGAWAAVAVKTGEDALATLKDTVLRATQSIPKSRLERTVRQMNARASASLSEAGAQPRQEALLLARAGAEGAMLQVRLPAAREVANRFLESRPGFVIAQPR